VTKPTLLQTGEHAVRPWLTGLVDAHRPLAMTHRVELTLETAAGPENVVADFRHLEQALSALVSNAIEASLWPGRKSEAPLVAVTSRTMEDGSNGAIWELRVADSGPGVVAEMRESIFQPYFTTKKDGNGIGLAVAQSVVKAHGGRISVEECPEGVQGPAGAHFVIRIPMNGGSEPAEQMASTGQ
jgi:signal transduction histidine kinase